jgi:hypothetical protein
MEFALTESTPARISAAAWLVVPIAWSVSIVLDRTREWEGFPQQIWVIGWLALIVAGVMQLIAVVRATRQSRGVSIWAGIGLLGLGLAASVVVAWAVVIWAPLYAVGMLLVGAAARNRVALLTGAGFAMATVAFFVLTTLAVGRPDSYGDYPTAGVAALLIATVGAALGMLVWPQAVEEVAGSSMGTAATI